MPKSLIIEVLEGEGEMNDIRARTAREPIVEVQDENHKPVAGALVLFAIQSGGGNAGGAFSGVATLSVRTGSDGRVIARGFHPNKNTGDLAISVTATVGAITAIALIHQTNYAGAVSLKKKAEHVAANKITILAAAEVAAFVTVIVETRSPSSTSISVGAGGVGHP